MIDCSRVQQLMDTKSAAWEEYEKYGLSFDTTKAIFDGGFSGLFGAALRAAYDASGALRREQKAMSAAFAAERGWKLTRFFPIDQLRRRSNGKRWGDRWFIESPLDHAEYFRLARAPWRPIAILSHEYSPFTRSLEFALENGLTAELLPASWYYPGGCNAVLYMSIRDLLR